MKYSFRRRHLLVIPALMAATLLSVAGSALAALTVSSNAITSDGNLNITVATSSAITLGSGTTTVANLTVTGSCTGCGGGGGTPAGDPGQIQFNDGGSFGADAGLEWDNTSKSLSITTNTNSALVLDVSGGNDGIDITENLSGSDNVAGLWNQVYFDGTATGGYTGIYVSGRGATGSSLSEYTGISVNSFQALSGAALTDFFGERIKGTSGSGSVSNVHGIQIDPLYGGPASDNVYGIEIKDQTGATNNWAIKTGLGKVEFGGPLIVNSTQGEDGILSQVTNGGVAAIDAQVLAANDGQSMEGVYISTNAGGHAVGDSWGIYMENMPSGSNQWAIQTGRGRVEFGDVMQTDATTYSSLPTCNSGNEGSQRAITDSSTNTWGATISGGGANHVLAYCDGTNWTVMAK